MFVRKLTRKDKWRAIQSSYKNWKWSEDLTNKLWIDYASAAVQLYGITPFGQVADMISAQTEEQVSEEEIKQWIEDPFGGSLAKAALEQRFVYLHPGNFFVGQWIVEFDEFDSHLAQQQGKPFYVPEQQELLIRIISINRMSTGRCRSGLSRSLRKSAENTQRIRELSLCATQFQGEEG